jgi:hypothetical protein
MIFCVCFFTDSRGSTLYIYMYVSFVQTVHDGCPCLNFTNFRIHHSFSVTSQSPELIRSTAYQRTVDRTVFVIDIDDLESEIISPNPRITPRHLYLL